MRNLDILAAENGEHVRVLLCGEEQSYVVSCQHFQMPYPVASDLLAKLQPVPAETYSVFVLDEDITNRQREGRNRKLDLIAPLLEDACIYDKSHRNEIVRQIAAEHGIARRTVLQYLWRYWVYALKPIERLARLTTKRKRCQHIIHSLFAPQSIPLCKNVIHQTRTVNFADAANRNLFTENIVDLNSRFPQSIVFCNGAVLYILMQMVPGKKSLQAVCITHRARS